MARRGRRPRHVCIYLITCVASKRLYVGSSKDMCMRWNSHLWDLINWKHSNSQLLIDWKRYGLTGFTFSILEIVEDVTQLRKKEQLWMDKLRSQGKTLYNLRKA